MDVCFWNKCNNHCLMCTNPEDFGDSDEYSYRDVYSRLMSQKKNQVHMTMTGGEPTINPDFIRIIEYIKRDFSGTDVTLLTNGRRLSYPAFAKKCLEVKNLQIAVSLHGYNSQTHDRVTLAKGSFAQTVSGIANILKYRNSFQGLTIRLVITKLTCEYVYKILDFISGNFPKVDKVAVMFMEIEGWAEKNIELVGLTYKEWQRQLSLIRPRIKNFRQLQFYHFPLCTITVDLWKYVWRTLSKHELTFSSQCKECWCKKYCLGVPKAYAKLIGDKEFSPPKKVIIKEDNIDPQHHPITNVDC